MNGPEKRGGYTDTLCGRSYSNFRVGKMKLPERVDIRVAADGKPAPGMFVCVTLRMARKNDFALGFGPSDQDGRVRISREDLLQEAEKERRFFIMDYGHPEEDFGGELVIKPLNRDDLAKATAAYEVYHDVTDYPPRHKDKLRDAAARLNQHGHCELSVEVEHVDRGVRIQTETRTA
jgi:hypothetical protein